MRSVGVHEAKSRLSELLRGVEDGEEVEVTRGGRAVARIVPVPSAGHGRPRFGALAEQIADPGDWEDDDDAADLFGIPED